MSAHEQMKNMLDELMGTGRDGENNRYKVRFDDSRVCKSFLLSCCPHDILSSTRMDLGECPNIHDLALRADYEMAQKERDYFFDIDAMEHLSNFIGDCDRRTELAKKRLKETQEELSEEGKLKADIIHALGEQIGTLLAKAEQMGADGNVEDSMKLMEEMEELKKQKSAAEQEYRNSMPASTYQQQKLRVCEICSAYLGIHDNDRRLADHFGGKLHLGFIQIRDNLARLKEKVQERRLQREMEREQRKLEREAEDERRKAKSRSRSGSRSKRRRSRSRSKDRKRRSRSRSRDRKRRSRSRSKGRRHRTRSRSRDRRRRRSRSRSRDRRRRSRSRDRRRRSRSRSRSRRHRSRSRSKQSRSRRSRSRDKKSKSAEKDVAQDTAAEKERPPTAEKERSPVDNPSGSADENGIKNDAE